jgi:hypothetical protein
MLYNFNWKEIHHLALKVAYVLIHLVRFIASLFRLRVSMG